jgi:hypothetical protein
MSEAWPWLSVALLGAYHGINPAMGWLFAIARGLQEQSRRALLLALVPIALGHLASVALVVLLVGVGQRIIAPEVLRAAGGTVLIVLGIYKSIRPRSHPRWIGMRISLPELALWSFTMSTAHGAGLMLLPALVHASDVAHAHTLKAHHDTGTGLDAAAIEGGAWASIHTLTMFATMAVAALLVFDRFGIGILRHAWLNLDRIWAGVIVVSGVFTLLSV